MRFIFAMTLHNILRISYKTDYFSKNPSLPSAPATVSEGQDQSKLDQRVDSNYKHITHERNQRVSISVLFHEITEMIISPVSNDQVKLNSSVAAP